MATEPKAVAAVEGVADAAATEAAGKVAQVMAAENAARDAAATGAVAAAGTAVALAEGTAAQAQQVAAERVAQISERDEKWRTETSQRLERLEGENKAFRETMGSQVSLILERLPSTPPKSAMETAVVTEEAPQNQETAAAKGKEKDEPVKEEPRKPRRVKV